MIIDGDEEYTPGQIQEIREWAEWMSGPSKTLSGLIWSKVGITKDQYVTLIANDAYLKDQKITLDIINKNQHTRP